MIVTRNSFMQSTGECKAMPVELTFQQKSEAFCPRSQFIIISLTENTFKQLQCCLNYNFRHGTEIKYEILMMMLMVVGCMRTKDVFGWIDLI